MGGTQPKDSKNLAGNRNWTHGMHSEIHWLGIGTGLMECSLRFIGWEIGTGLIGMHSEIESIGSGIGTHGMQSEIESIGSGIGTHGMHSEIESIGSGIGTKASDLRINTRFRASPKAFIFMDYQKLVAHIKWSSSKILLITA